ncbi:MAG TPA: poly-beta-1,6-N-acetyl-D-glucosamine N-deacetylase PgaB [Burkholderiales bacterium]|nr:poly-beta-1,6-N-acetyl-D-glucosamine N-deacetylase PgaB [Burkholderiales bacterium]
MHRAILLLFGWLSSFACFAQAEADALKDLIVLCYHDVREALPVTRDDYVLEAGELVNQFAWLKEHGYTVVSLQQVVAARAGKERLPHKPVLLTFDDGYRSFYTHVYPLLRLFEYPALLALVGRWLEEPEVGRLNAPAHSPLLSWDEVRVLAESGLVEVASHSHDLHHGIHANPQGNELAAATTRLYDPGAKRYESDADYAQRIRSDLMRGAELIERRTGVRPRAIVWPYGSYNATTRRLASDAGMAISLGLDDVVPLAQPPGLHLGRNLIVGNPSLRQFAEELLRPYKPDPVRAVRVDLDKVFDPDAAQQEAKLSRLLDRIAAMGINTVYLRASADVDGDGATDAVYFPSQHLPVRADLFGRVSWQLHTRSGVRVFAWLPTRGIRWPNERATSGVNDEQRARRRVVELYQELARHAPFDGLLFDEGGNADDDREAPAFSQELLRAVEVFRPAPRTARAIPLSSLLTEAGARESAAAFSRLRGQYDQLVLRASQRIVLNKARSRQLARTVAKAPAGKAALVVELDGAEPAIDRTLHALQLQGIADLAFAPDDFLHDRPALEAVRPVVSLQSRPR